MERLITTVGCLFFGLWILAHILTDGQFNNMLRITGVVLKAIVKFIIVVAIIIGIGVIIKYMFYLR